MSFDRNVQTLVTVVQNLSSARTIEDIMRLVRTAAREIAQADGATFVFKDEGYCHYADEDAIAPLWKGQRFPLSACISGWCMLNKQAVIIEDIYKDARIPHDAYRPTFVKSLAMTPVRKHDPIAAIGTYWKTEHRPSDEQLAMLQALADTTSVSIENVRLYQNLESKVVELDKANQVKNEFLTMLSHELRTPLNSIVGWSEILCEVPWQETSLGEGAKSLRRNALAQAHVIEDLLDAAQMMSGEFPMDREPVDLCGCVLAAIDDESPATESKGIKVRLNSFIERAVVLGDFARLKQIVRSLLNNAIKFSPRGSLVDVELDKVGPHFCVRVKDRGIGIDPEFLPHVFESFRRDDESVLRTYGGMGLGLSIARSLTQAHQGQIFAQSEGLEKGSEFQIAIPAAESI